MKYLIYKITNQINGKYYIGRHRTINMNDSYMGSGKAILNAIKKYGIENFTKEIIAESWDESNLWELEKQIVNDDVVNDTQSYNMTYGGKHYFHGLKSYDPDAFIEHQRIAGLRGGPAAYNQKSLEEKLDWHKKGGRKSAMLHKSNKNHPFYNGAAASMGGKAIAGMIELWSPNSTATNKNQKDYKPGDCARVKLDSEKFKDLISQGWLPVKAHKNKRKAETYVIKRNV